MSFHPPTGVTPDTLLQGGSPFDFQGLAPTSGGLASSFLDALRGTDTGTESGTPGPDYSIPGFIGIPEFNEFSGAFIGYDYRLLPRGPGGTRGGAAAPSFRPGELALLQSELAEQKRSNLAREAASTRQITLDRALGSLTAYNTAQDIANQRRLTAFDQARQLAGFLIPKGTEFFPGLEPGGALAQVSQDFGLPFGGAPVVEQTFDVGALSQPGQISPQVTEMLAGLGGI